VERPLVHAPNVAGRAGQLDYTTEDAIDLLTVEKAGVSSDAIALGCTASAVSATELPAVSESRPVRALLRQKRQGAAISSASQG